MFVLLSLVVGLAASVQAMVDAPDNSTCDLGQWYDADAAMCRDDCKTGEVYDVVIGECVATSAKKMRPSCKNITLDEGQYERTGHDVYIPELNLTVPFDAVNVVKDKLSFCYNYSVSFMACKRWLLDHHEIEIRNNGLKVWVPDYKTLYDTGDFYLLPDHEEKMGAVVCVRKGNPEAHAEIVTVARVYYASWVISEICLVIAFILCITLPQFSFMYHILPFYIGSLFITYLMLILRTSSHVPSSGTCYFYAVTLQFFFLSAFFWLNVLAFDIWRTLSKRQWYLEVFNRHSHRLVGFSVYAFGIPFIIVLITVLIDVYNVGHETLQPNFLKNCWFSHNLSQLSFFYGPVAVILIINIIFFIMTLVGLRSNDKGLFRDAEEKKHLWRTALELAVLMGLCWIMEVISWAVGAPKNIWYFTDVINGLQGLFILIVILTKPKVFTTVREWLGIHLNCNRCKA